VRELYVSLYPKFLFRGGGGYVTLQVLRPKAKVEQVVPLKGDETLEQARSLPPMSDKVFNSIFKKRIDQIRT